MDYSDPKTQKKHLANFQSLVTFSNNLQQSTDCYFETFPLPVFLMDSMGRFIYANRAAETFIRYQRSEMIGQHFRLLLTLDDLSDGFKFFHGLFRGQQNEITRFRIRLKEGSTRVVDMNGAPVMLKNKIVAAIVIATDVTGVPSQNTRDRVRVETFKKFMVDLENWEKHSEKYLKSKKKDI